METRNVREIVNGVSSTNRHPQATPQTVYIHVPFCRHRCGYCDFTLIAGRDELIDRYLAALDRELPQFESPQPIFTLFLGGGTPTHPPIEKLRVLFDSLARRYDFRGHAEVSVEANPLDLTDDKLKFLVDAGVNRISLGVQSFDADVLKSLERDHLPAQLPGILQRCQNAIENLSLDLIFGVPGQTLASWEGTLKSALQFHPAHLSTYGLTFEPGTAFNTRKQRGELAPIDDGIEREMYSLAMTLLEESGYQQYEISSFARPGFACQHNQVYWSGDDYAAFGPGAAQYLHGRRETNIRSVLAWMSRVEAGKSVVADAEELAPEQRARELIYLGLRRIAGISRTDFLARTGFALDEFATDALQTCQTNGWLEDDGESIRLSREGRFLADRVAMEFL